MCVPIITQNIAIFNLLMAIGKTSKKTFKMTPPKMMHVAVVACLGQYS